jgi:hypothetical protein
MQDTVNTSPLSNHFIQDPDGKYIVAHTTYVEGCFRCKLNTLQLNTGEAGRADSKMTQKEWDRELDFYRDARKQGVQPESTSRKSVEKALEASAVLGKAYNAENMPKASKINKEVVSVMKEIGQI